jgi:broad specificity phosphatase PhoE
MLSTPRTTEFLVLRHAHVHNPHDIVYGRLPRFRLSDRGREQAELAGRFLSVRPITAVYSSPLLRARQTAAIVARHLPGVTVHQSAALLEVRTSYQGSPDSIIKPGFSFYEPPKHPSDESMEAVFLRLSRLLQRLVRTHSGESVVLVSHADPIAILRVGLQRLPLTAANLHHTVYPARASVTQVQLLPGEPLRLSYFDVVGEGPG